MIQNLIKSNQQYKNAYDMTMQLLNSGKSQEEILNQVCKQNGIDINSVKGVLNNSGINIK